MRREAQAALESLSLIGFLTLTTLILTTSLLSTLQEKRVGEQEAVLDTLSETLAVEVQLAQNAPPGYTRNITIPTKIDGHAPVITLVKNPENGMVELMLQLPTGVSTSTLLPPRVYGLLAPGVNTVRKLEDGSITLQPREVGEGRDENVRGNIQVKPSRIRMNKTNATLPLLVNCTMIVYNGEVGEYVMRTQWTYQHEEARFIDDVEERVVLESGVFEYVYNATKELTRRTWPDGIPTIQTMVTCNQTVFTPSGDVLRTREARGVRIENTPPRLTFESERGGVLLLEDVYTQYLETCLKDEEKRDELARYCEDDMAGLCGGRDMNCPFKPVGSCSSLNASSASAWERLAMALWYSLFSMDTHEDVLSVCAYEQPGNDDEGRTNTLRAWVAYAEARVEDWIQQDASDDKVLQAYCTLSPKHCIGDHAYIPVFLHPARVSLVLTDEDTTDSVYTLTTLQGILNQSWYVGSTLPVTRPGVTDRVDQTFTLLTVDVDACTQEKNVKFILTDKSMDTQETVYTTVRVENECPISGYEGNGGGTAGW